MRSPRPTLLLVALLSLAGCAGSPYSADVVFSPGLHTAVRAPFRYPLPEGWFNALQGSDSSRYLVWLVRNDYAAAFTIEEMTLDPAAATQVERHGVRSAAEISLALSSATPATLLLSGLDDVPVSGRTGFAFEQVHTGSGDTTRTVVFGAGGRVFEAHAVAIGKRKNASRGDVFSVQQRVLEALGWTPTSSS